MLAEAGRKEGRGSNVVEKMERIPARRREREIEGGRAETGKSRERGK